MVEQVLRGVGGGEGDAPIEECFLALGASLPLKTQAKEGGEGGCLVTLDHQLVEPGFQHVGVHGDAGLGHGDYGPDQVGVVADRIRTQLPGGGPVLMDAPAEFACG